jgi:hypothetical protein
MKTSTLVLVIVGAVLAVLLALGVLGGAVGYVVYHNGHATPFPIADPAALEPLPTGDAALSYQMRLPRGWRISAESLARKIHLWMASAPDVFDGRGFTANLNVTTKAYSGSRYADAAIRTHQRDHADFHLLARRRVMINGRVAEIIDYTIASKTGLPLHLQQTFISSGGTVYILTGASHERAWESHRMALESSIASFEFTR